MKKIKDKNRINKIQKCDKLLQNHEKMKTKHKNKGNASVKNETRAKHRIYSLNSGDLHDSQDIGLEKLMFGVYKYRRKLYTKNLVPGHKTYSENILVLLNEEYREWDPKKSKIAAAIMLGAKLNFNSRMNILYLGASSGTTVSHLSDIVRNGKIFAVEFANKMFRRLYYEALFRGNIFPIFADASKPEQYLEIVPSVDFLFQDIAQKHQLDIFLKNLFFLKKHGLGMIAVKARSVDVTKPAKEIFKLVKKELISCKMIKLLQYLNISRYEKDHAIFLIEKL